MKKIVKPTGEIRLKGIAESDGVAFEAARVLDFMSVSTQGTKATVSSDGTICSQTLEHGIYPPQIDHKISDLANKSFKFISILPFVTFVGSMVLVFFTTFMYQVLLSLFFLSMACVFLNKGIAIFLAHMRGDQEIVSFSKFLAAKNAVENAYYSLGKVPSVEEAKNYSILSHNSHYLNNDYMATFFVVASVLRFLPGIWYMLAFVIFLAVYWLVRKKSIHSFWQFLIVSSPDDIHYETAIAALHGSVHWTESVKVHVMAIPFPFPLEMPFGDFSEEECADCELYDFCKEMASSEFSNSEITPNGSTKE